MGVIEYVISYIVLSVVAALLISSIAAKHTQVKMQMSESEPVCYRGIEYSPAENVMACTGTPLNENNDGDIDNVKKFYPAASLR